MAKSGNELRPRQLRALECLLTQADVKAAALSAGVGYRTLRGWLRQPAFQQALQEVESEALRALQRRLVALGNDAADVLEQAMGPSERTGDRLRASGLVLDNLLRLRELVELTARIEALEQRLEGKDGH
ncbi:MAG: hypothetical protein ACUVS5_14075 [Anaerolineae bacterium]